MSNVALEMNHVFKKFKKGEYDCLRDLIPALCGKILKRNQRNSLQEREFWALQDVSFQVNRGECVGIIGRNGAGKSTILKLLCRIMKPTKGEMKVNGNLSALIDVGAGFHQDLTGRENVYLNGTILGMKKWEIDKKFDEIVEFSGIGQFIDTPVKRYSSGMYARLGFAVAAHVDAEILIVDEALSVGDITFQNQSMKKIKSIVEGGSTVIFVSHDPRAVTELCRRCILLDQGRILDEGPAKEVVGRYLDAQKVRTWETSKREVFISRVFLHGQNGGNSEFTAGQKAWFEIEVKSKVECEKLSVSLNLLDNDYVEVFNTSTERLNRGSISLKEGESKKITFELILHLAPGKYHLGTHVYRSDIQKEYDSATDITLYVSCNEDVRGIANLYPTVSIS